MRLSERSYPHPVIGNRDDVPGVSFQPSISVSSDKQNIYLDIEIRCSSSHLSELVAAERATFFAHIECSNTLFREAYGSQKERFRITVPAKKLFNRFEVNVFACATKRIANLQLEGAHQDYAGASFDLDPGDILAIGEGREFFIETEDALSKVGSIMEIVPSPRENDGPMAVEWNDAKITILLSKKDFAAYNIYKEDEHLGSALATGIVLPVLAQALKNIQGDDFGDLRWATNLTRRLEAMGIDPATGFDELEVAQRLLELPIKRSLASVRALQDREA